MRIIGIHLRLVVDVVHMDQSKIWMSLLTLCFDPEICMGNGLGMDWLVDFEWAYYGQ